MDTEEEVTAALLHDVAEDTDITFEDMAKLGISENVLRALKLLTYDQSVPYMEYAARLAEHPLAAKVKRADLMPNSDLSPLAHIDAEALERIEKYKKAMALIEDVACRATK